ncbi:MAG: Do family serine endopeptidase [Alphaproteobacteria bacterium]
MFKSAKIFFIGLFLTVTGFAFAHGIQSFSGVVKKTIPAVVSIQATYTTANRTEMLRELKVPKEMEKFFEDFFNEQQRNAQPNKGQGSGFIFDKSGYVITNNHVVYRANDIKVVLQDGTTYKAVIKGVDSLTDLAVLKLQGVKKPLPTIEFANSEKAEIGDWVIAIGNPMGLGGSVTKGIISASGRNIQSGLYDDYIQTDTPINRGNSGGPLINMDGKVIGINTAIMSPTGGNIGLGFAIPSNLAKNIATQLLKKGSVSRAWLGVSMRPVSVEIADSLGLKQVEGVIISGVQSGSPADKGGIKVGDVILEVGGKKITKRLRLPMIIASLPINKKVKFTIVRAGKIKFLNIKLTKREERTAFINKPAPKRLIKKTELLKTGIMVADINTEIRKLYSIGKNVRGVVVTDIHKTSSAYGLLKEGMVILKINDLPTTSSVEAEKIVRMAIKRNKKNILLIIETGQNRKAILTVELK